MRLAPRDLPAHADRHAEVCVVGTGPAGTTVASELARAGRSVVLLEAGGEAVTNEAQAVFRGTVVGDPYFDLESIRLRCLGGTSVHWAGWCRPLDAEDFADKPAFPLARWPIGKADLDPYAARAERILGLDPLPADEVVDAAAGLRRIWFNMSDPVRFWETFGERLESAPNVAVVTGANVTLVATDGARVTGLEVTDEAGGTVEVRADRYVLATGGIENSRILLWSDAVQNGALVPPAAPLGRYWMEHPHQSPGAALIPGYYRTVEWGHGWHFFALSAEARRRLGVLACGLRLIPMRREETATLIEDLACAAPRLAARTAREILSNRACGARLDAAWEQEPSAGNRIALSRDETDRFGMPRPVLHWRKSERDLRTLRETALAFGDWLARTNAGRLRLEPWVLDLDSPEGGEMAGKHHMGGTRMADTPELGVVDRNCRVFGQDNLYVAGSSVFPSSGHANPTQTIVQLALRLADHLSAG